MYLKRVRTVDRHVIDSIIPTFRRSYRQVGDRANNQAVVPTFRRSYLILGKSKETRKVSD
ncbi:hypothetical protein QUA54_12485 [Microcoleus sp. MOSTC5]